MKNHIAFKFLAVLLCALTLLGSIVCIIGIAALEQQDLYNSDIPAQQEEYKQRLLSYAAGTVLSKYAANLGGCPDRLLQEYYGTYSHNDYLVDGAWFYTLTDPDGKTLESNVPANREDLASYPFENLSTWYIELVDGPVKSERYTGDHGRDPMMTPTVEPTEDPSSTDPTQPASGGIYGFIYWDDEVDGYMETKLRDVRIEGYTVIIHANDASFTERSDWQILTFAWENRYNLIAALVICLLLFAIGAVYLCCAAGRTPGSDEIRPGGFNALPLDFYAALVLFLTAMTYWVVQEIYDYFRYSQIVFFTFLLFAGFFVCLLFVAFCFACAAQFKMGGGHWWRNSVIGWSALTLIRFIGEATMVHIPSFCRWLWNGLKALARGIKKVVVYVATGLWKLLKLFFRFLLDVAVVVWLELKKLLGWLWNKITRAFWWLGRKVHRVLSLLPVTWQWLLIGFVMLLFLFLTTQSYNSTMVLIGCGAFLLLIVYGAHAFGLLLEGVKKMRQGELDAAVDHRLLVGAFREFAGELNGLADVAKVAAQKEMKSERMKTELITNVSHDIKTPLTSIINYVDLLQKPHTPEEEQEYLEVLGRKSQQLKKLIQDLMEMSKASTGNMSADIRRVDAVEAVNQALGEYADKLTASDLTPVFKAPDSPVWIMADGRLTWRVLSNLLSNAVKYALPGTRLYVDLTRSHGKVLLSLKNVSAQELNVDAEELMERFVRGDAARNSDGSGLGLNIAKSLMEVQNGQLVLTVDGDLFKVTLTLPEG